jgi:hypothetical protein
VNPAKEISTVALPMKKIDPEFESNEELKDESTISFDFLLNLILKYYCD